MLYSEFIQDIINTRGQWCQPNNVRIEMHHIIPRCLGGLDNGQGRFKKKSTHPNCIYLTLQEHFTAHFLLVIENPKNKDLCAALFYMCNVSKKYDLFNISAEQYEMAREVYYQHFGKQHSKDMIGRHWYNNGTIEIFQYECPPGYITGRLPFSEKTCKQMANNGASNGAYGKHWYTNGIDTIFTKDCPDGYYLGMSPASRAECKSVAGLSWYNDGVTEKYAAECPEGFIKGRLYKMKGLKWYNNGIKNIRTMSCPDGFIPGFIRQKDKTI